MKRREATAEDVREEHLEDVTPSRQWMYLVAVLGGGFALMLALIAVLGAS